MKKLSKQSFEEIRLWIHRNAREIDLAIWQYEFENGSKEAVLSALSHYQNDDGGFGNALEPDNWNLNSSPYATMIAINKLKNINFKDINHTIMQGILRFLGSGKHCVENGWLFSIQTNNDFPHAPWLNYDPNEQPHIGVTTELVCFLLEFTKSDFSLYLKASSLTDKLLARFNEHIIMDEMSLSGFCTLLEKIKQLQLTNRFDITFLSSMVKKLVDKAIVRDVSKWAEYGVKPSLFIHSPDSEFYQDNEEIVQQELDYYVDTRPANSVWPITWQWYDKKYPEEFAVSANWWKADLCLSTMRLLRRFGRIE